MGLTKEQRKGAVQIVETGSKAHNLGVTGTGSKGESPQLGHRQQYIQQFFSTLSKINKKKWLQFHFKTTSAPTLSQIDFKNCWVLSLKV